MLRSWEPAGAPWAALECWCGPWLPLLSKYVLFGVHWCLQARRRKGQTSTESEAESRRSCGRWARNVAPAPRLARLPPWATLYLAHAPALHKGRSLGPWVQLGKSSLGAAPIALPLPAPPPQQTAAGPVVVQALTVKQRGPASAPQPASAACSGLPWDGRDWVGFAVTGALPGVLCGPRAAWLHRLGAPFPIAPCYFAHSDTPACSHA
jgi:hypothetical protein